MNLHTKLPVRSHSAGSGTHSAHAGRSLTVSLGASSCLGVFVAVLAMCCALACLGRGYSTDFANSDAALNIDGSRDRLQVCRVDAVTDSAEMVKVQAFRNRTNEAFVRQSMRQARDSKAVSPDRQPRVASRVNSAGPQPTAVLVYHALGLQAFRDRFSGAGHDSIVTDVGVGVMNRLAQYEAAV